MTQAIHSRKSLRSPLAGPAVCFYPDKIERFQYGPSGLRKRRTDVDHCTYENRRHEHGARGSPQNTHALQSAVSASYCHEGQGGGHLFRTVHIRATEQLIDNVHLQRRGQTVELRRGRRAAVRLAANPAKCELMYSTFHLAHVDLVACLLWCTGCSTHHSPPTECMNHFVGVPGRARTVGAADEMHEMGRACRRPSKSSLLANACPHGCGRDCKAT